MDEDDKFELGCVVMILIVVFIAGSIYFWAKGGYDGGYRDGQIDAIQGNVKYELRDQADGSRAWAEKKASER